METVDQPTAWATPHQPAGFVVQKLRITDAIGGALRSAFQQRRSLPDDMEATLARLDRSAR